MDVDRVEGRFVLVDADNAYTGKIYMAQYINIRLHCGMTAHPMTF